MVVCRQQIDAMGGIRAFVKACVPSALELAQNADLNPIFHRRCSDDKLIAKRSRAAHCMLVASKTVDKLNRIFVGLHCSTIIIRVTELTATEHILVAHALTERLVLKGGATNIGVQSNVVNQIIAQMLRVSWNSNHKVFYIAEEVANGLQQRNTAARSISRGSMDQERDRRVRVVSIRGQWYSAQRLMVINRRGGSCRVVCVCSMLRMRRHRGLLGLGQSPWRWRAHSCFSGTAAGRH